jgi:hypothetical protein
MILRAMSAVASATGRATHAGQVEGDGPDKRRYPAPLGWGLGVRLTTSPRKKITLTKPYNKPRNVMKTRLRMERQSKGSRHLEAYRRGGQGPPRAVAPFKKKKKL